MFFGLAPVSQEPAVKIVSPRPEAPAAPPENPEPQVTASETEPVTAEKTPEPVTEPEPDAAAEIEPVPDTEPIVEPSQPEEALPVVPERFLVKFIARGTVWMRLQADEDKAIDITMRSGERYRIKASRTLTARMGNPVLVDIFYNDEPVTLAGKPGIPLDVVFPDIVRQAAPKTQ